MSQSVFYLIDSAGATWQVSITPSGNLQATQVAAGGTTPPITPLGTYTPNDAITMARQMSHKIPVTTIQAYIADIINSIIWTRFTWTWTLTPLTPIALVDGTQDYALATADAASFYRFPDWGLRIVQTNLTPVEHREITQKSHLGVELTMKGGLGSIRNFSYEGALSKIRLDRAASVSGSTTLQIQGEYQTKPTKITDALMGTVLSFPDHYFSVFFEGVRWKLYELAQDPRAGVMKIDDEGRQTYTAQYGTFMTSLFAMQQAEDAGSGEDLCFPDSPLGSPRGSSPGIF